MIGSVPMRIGMRSKSMIPQRTDVGLYLEGCGVGK
jgi:hypothetical protein